jgi:hypothetical protein
MAGIRPWGPEDRTSGALDVILSSVHTRFPDAIVTRLVGTHPADDDNVFWVQLQGTDVQIDTGDGGSPPFTIESAVPGTRLDTHDTAAATEFVNQLLESAREA